MQPTLTPFEFGDVPGYVRHPLSKGKTMVVVAFSAVKGVSVGAPVNPMGGVCVCVHGSLDQGGRA